MGNFPTFQRMVLLTFRLPQDEVLCRQQKTHGNQKLPQITYHHFATPSIQGEIVQMVFFFSYPYDMKWGRQSVQLIELDFNSIKVEIWNQQRSPSQARQHIATSRLDVDRWKTCFESFISSSSCFFKLAQMSGALWGRIFGHWRISWYRYVHTMPRHVCSYECKCNIVYTYTHTYTRKYIKITTSIWKKTIQTCVYIRMRQKLFNPASVSASI